jgi:UDP-N-acetylmuramoyl-tripeptide--D-alanyl-D-alanine ligase
MKNKLGLLVLYWLRFWAKLKLAVCRPMIIGVTGSAGKTSAHQAMGLILKDNFSKVKISQRANSESGIPADILGMHFENYSLGEWLKICLKAPIQLVKASNFKYYLVEMGIDESTPPKNMEYLLSILQPQIGVLLNVLPAHTQQFGSVTAIKKEKTKLIDKRFNRKLEKVIDMTKKQKLPGYEVSLKKTAFEFSGNLMTLPYPVPEFYRETFGATYQVGLALGVEPSKIVRSLKRYELPKGRGRLLVGIKDSLIIDSSYNSSPGPTADSLRLLSKITGKRRRVAVLGDMRELGKLAEEEHQKLSDIAIKKADLVVTVGPLTREYFDERVKNFSNAIEAGKWLAKMIKKSDLILVKGSQNTIFLEETVKVLLRDKKDISQLCRQSEYWMRIKTC